MKYRSLACVALLAPIVVFSLNSSKQPDIRPEQNDASETNAVNQADAELAASEAIKAPGSLGQLGEYELFPGNTARLKHQRNAPREKLFVFPDGRELLIAIVKRSPRQVSDSPLPEKSDPKFFESAANRASTGDSEAALALADALEYCEPFPKTKAEFDQFVEDTHSGSMPTLSAQPTDITVWTVRAAFERCQGATEAMYDDSLSYLRLAAERGDTQSALRFANAVKDDDAEQAERYFKQAWDAGWVRGLEGVADIASRRESLSFEQQLEAYSQAYAAQAVFLAWMDGMSTDGIKVAKQQVHVRLMEIEGSIPPAMMSDVFLRAAAIIANHDKCCVIY